MAYACVQKGEGDVLVRAVDKSNFVRVSCVCAGSLVQSALERHKMSPTAAAALGRGLMGTLLLVAGREEGESIQALFRGDGMLGSMLCLADSTGNVKGRVGNATAHNESLNVGDVMGNGTLSVSRTLPFAKEPYTGTVELHNGEIGDDIAVYLAQSEQVHSAIGLGITLQPDAAVEHAAGFLVQVMPDCDESTLSKLEVNVDALPAPTELMKEGKSAEDIAHILLDGLEPRTVDTVVPQYGPCARGDLQNRMLKALALIDREEVDSILDERGDIEMTCEFCAETHTFSREEVESFLAHVKL